MVRLLGGYGMFSVTFPTNDRSGEYDAPLHWNGERPPADAAKLLPEVSFPQGESKGCSLVVFPFHD